MSSIRKLQKKLVLRVYLGVFGYAEFESGDQISKFKMSASKLANFWKNEPFSHTTEKITFKNLSRIFGYANTESNIQISKLKMAVSKFASYWKKPAVFL